MTRGDRIAARRKELGFTQVELAEAIGESKQTIYKYESGIVTNIPLDKLEAIAKVLKCPPEELAGWGETRKVAGYSSTYPTNIIPMPGMSKIPIIGTIACGQPILAEENLIGEVDLPEHVHADFALRCKGDSMINARIYDGDIVYIRQQPTVEDGEIAAVLIEDEATLKRVHFYSDHIVLAAENPLFRPLAYWEEEMNSIRILGKAVAFTSVVR